MFDIFYHNTLKNIVVGFGTLFNNIYVVRTTSGDVEIERFKVPLIYSSTEKMFARVTQDPEIDKEVAVTLPAMGFEQVSLTYDGTRHRNQILRNRTAVDADNVNHQFTGVPYNIGFELTIVSKKTDDGNQILEQILPYFTPTFTLTMNTVPEMVQKDDILITLESISKQDDYEGGFEDKRLVTRTLNFTAKAFFYGPVSTQGIIKQAIVDIHIASGADDIADSEIGNVPRHVRFITVPDPIGSTSDDDYGFTITTTEFDDGKIRSGIDGTDIDIP